MRRLKRSECKVLPLVLKGRWYAMIESGAKREEYRDCSEYWTKRLENWWRDDECCYVEFRHGYGHNAPRMAFIVDEIPEQAYYPMHEEWGEPTGLHFVIKLGRRVEWEARDA